MSVESGRVLGIAGLFRRDTLPVPDLGFAFLPEARGRGFAAEAARAVLDWARASLGLRRVLALAAPDNAASLKLLARLGFAESGRVRSGGASAPESVLLELALAPEVAAAPRV
jgi:RimJ/RimL family protein N-acetyltransferase